MYLPKTAILFILLAQACGHSDDGHDPNESEVITSVVLQFESVTADTVEAVFDDPDGDGGEPPTIDMVELEAGEWSLALRFENRLENPPEDISAEIFDEADEHQVFFTGSGVDGPASDSPGAPLAQTYADMDDNGLPLGLESSIVASSGTGELIVTLRHLPPLGGTPVKSANVANEVRSGGFASIGGSSDAQVTFSVTVP